MNQTSVLGVGGEVLLVVIVVLLFLEEAGLPLFLTAGDLLLAVGGVAMGSGELNGAVFVSVSFTALLAGALVGWELFHRLGWTRLMAIAHRLHAERLVERAAALLRGGGWRAVFVARLVPGLRIHTMQVAAASGMERRTFLLGLVPANIVYVAGFVGLGYGVGHPVLSRIDQAGVTIAVAVAVVVLLLALRTRIRRAAVRLELDDWRGAFLRLPSLAGLALVPVAIGLNTSGHALAQAWHLPLFLDSVGTVLAALVAGPWIGGAAGAVSNLVSSTTIDPIAAPYWLVSLALGFAVGLAARRDWAARLRGAVVLWLVCVVVAVALSTPLNLMTNGGNTGVGAADALVSTLLDTHIPSPMAAAMGEAVVDVPDKLLTVTLALLLVAALPARRAAGGLRPVPPS